MKRPVWADQVVWLNIFLGEEQVGNLALLARKPAMACGIKNLDASQVETLISALAQRCAQGEDDEER